LTKNLSQKNSESVGRSRKVGKKTNPPLRKRRNPSLKGTFFPHLGSREFAVHRTPKPPRRKWVRENFPGHLETRWFFGNEKYSRNVPSQKDTRPGGEAGGGSTECGKSTPMEKKEIRKARKNRRIWDQRGTCRWGLSMYAGRDEEGTNHAGTIGAAEEGKRADDVPVVFGEVSLLWVQGQHGGTEWFSH